jgi:hypothetical protein
MTAAPPGRPGFTLKKNALAQKCGKRTLVSHIANAERLASASKLGILHRWVTDH